MTRLDDVHRRLVANAVLHLKKYSLEKYVFKPRGLMEMPIGKKGFDEKFKLAVEK